MNDETVGQLRFGECLLHLPPIMRACASCEELYNCARGNEVCFGDMSLTDRVIKLDYYINDMSKLQEMSLAELREYNAAIRAKKEIDAHAINKQQLTAGMYNADTDTWTDGVNTQCTAERPNPNSKLTAGKWDNKTKRWIT